jgi:hypothetical protein
MKSIYISRKPNSTQPFSLLRTTFPYPCTTSLCSYRRIMDVRHYKTRNQSTQALDQMIDVIDSHIKDIVNKHLQSSEFVGINIDEITDITVHKKLNILL